VVQKAVFPCGSSLSAQTYGSSIDVQKFITLRLFIVSRCTNNRWKQERVFYNYYIGLLVRFQTCQRWNLIFYLLLTVKLDLTSMSEMFILSFLGGFMDGHLSWCFNIVMECLSCFHWSLLEHYTFDSSIAWV
jgi:hypothetical protein